MRLILFALLLLVWPAADAAAHTRSQSQSRWIVEGDALAVSVEADALDVTRLYAMGGEAALTDMLAQEAASAFTVRANGQGCERVGAPTARLLDRGRVVALLRFVCPQGALAHGTVDIESGLFLNVAASHLHFVSFRDADGQVAEAVLTGPHPRAELDPAGAPPTQSILGAVLRFLPVGAEHVWTGLDHVAFILALVLLAAGGARRVILAATGFTLGHTATLGLAATGVLRPDTVAIEALIGFTIAFVALEAGQEGESRMREWSGPAAVLLGLGGLASLFGMVAMSPLIWFGLAVFVFAFPRGFPKGALWLPLIFGLIHGCGFAGALSELDLPRPRLLASLLGFNLGVEAGQIVVILAAVGVGLAVRHAPAQWRSLGATLAGAALFALGVYWFAGRL